jgi:hypothetical protein
MLILAGHYGQSWPTRMLQLKIIVWVGLGSYSAYLWHRPILAFLRYGQFTIDFQVGIAVIFLTLLLAWLTYRYVEQPLRRSNLSFIQIAFRQYAITAAVIGVACLVSMKLDGYAFRWLVKDCESRIAEVRDSIRPAFQYDCVCQKQRIEATDLEDPACIVGLESADVPQVILWGDSNAAHYIGMLGAFAEEAGFRFRNVEVSSCPPIHSGPERFVAAVRLDDCRYSSQVALDALEQYDTVIISAAWTGYQSLSVGFLVQFEDTVRELLGRNQHVIILGRAPIISGYDRRCRAKAVSFPLVDCKAPCSTARQRSYD